jgi:hypothetical protein
MYQPRPLKELHHEAELFWIYVENQWRMASIVWQGGMPSAVSFAPSAITDSWDACCHLPAIAIAA